MHSHKTEMRKPPPHISVLVVDDDRDARAMYRMYLTHVGCRVRTARDGQVAITKANHWPPDVIVMDLAMPRLDGWSASKSLKSSPATAHIPIIALSAASEAREGARACGCDGFLAKPCQPDLLWWEIRALLHPAS
jgi:CheY-like chemotaxis protein